MNIACVCLIDSNYDETPSHLEKMSLTTCIWIFYSHVCFWNFPFNYTLNVVYYKSSAMCEIVARDFFSWTIKICIITHMFLFCSDWLLVFLLFAWDLFFPSILYLSWHHENIIMAGTEGSCEKDVWCHYIVIKLTENTCADTSLTFPRCWRN